jgi:hypothetical protein
MWSLEALPDGVNAAASEIHPRPLEKRAFFLSLFILSYSIDSTTEIQVRVVCSSHIFSLHRLLIIFDFPNSPLMAIRRSLSSTES